LPILLFSFFYSSSPLSEGLREINYTRFIFTHMNRNHIYALRFHFHYETHFSFLERMRKSFNVKKCDAAADLGCGEQEYLSRSSLFPSFHLLFYGLRVNFGKSLLKNFSCRTCFMWWFVLQVFSLMTKSLHVGHCLFSFAFSLASSSCSLIWNEIKLENRLGLSWCWCWEKWKISWKGKKKYFRLSVTYHK
jgi:hypothetical protein